MSNLNIPIEFFHKFEAFAPILKALIALNEDIKNGRKNVVLPNSKLYQLENLDLLRFLFDGSITLIFTKKLTHENTDNSEVFFQAKKNKNSYKVYRVESDFDKLEYMRERFEDLDFENTQQKSGVTITVSHNVYIRSVDLIKTLKDSPDKSATDLCHVISKYL